MSNNDLSCSKCGSQHHPACCPLDEGVEMKELKSILAFHDYKYGEIKNKDILAQAIRAEIKRLIPEEKDIQLTSHKGCLNTKDYEKGHNNCVKIIKGRLLDE